MSLKHQGQAGTCLSQPVPTVKSSQRLYQVGVRHRHVANILPAGTVSAKDSPISAQTPAIKGNSLMCLGKPKIWATWAAESLSLCLWVRNPCSTPPSHPNPTTQVPPCALRRETSTDGLCGSTWRDAEIKFHVHCYRNAMPSISPCSKPLLWILVFWYHSRFAKG